MIPAEERQQIIAAKTQDAEEMIAVAELNYQHGFYNSAVNRLYYACFHMASAALLAIGIEDVHRHEGVRNMFSLHFIKAGRIGLEWKAFYGTMFSNRSNADYDNFKSFTKEQIEEMLPLVKQFVSTLKSTVASLEQQPSQAKPDASTEHI